VILPYGADGDFREQLRVWVFTPRFKLLRDLGYSVGHLNLIDDRTQT